MKKLLICALLLVFALCIVSCDGQPAEIPTEAPTEASTEALTEAPTEAPTEASTEAPTEAPTEACECAPTEAPTEALTEAPTEEATTEAPASIEPTAYFSVEDIAALTATNATVSVEDGYVHFLTGTENGSTNPCITLTAEGDGFTDIIAIRYRTNCGGYGSNYWGTFLLNGTDEFQGNRYMSDNWFYYTTDGEWDVLVLDMRRNTAGSEGVPDTDVTGGAEIKSLVYNFFDYAGNGGKLATADGAEEYIDIGYVAFFESADDAYEFINS